MSEKDLPRAAQKIAEWHPEVYEAYEKLGEACGTVGPLDGKTRHLIKIATAIALRSEGATHSHVRRALRDGVSPEEIRHASLLVAPTAGFPQAVAGRTWIEDILRS
jgi:4-carboxymuconolactone decarboxylase